MVFYLEITCDDDAFGEDEFDRRAEIARILREAATSVIEIGAPFVLLDVNGNVVGRATSRATCSRK